MEMDVNDQSINFHLSWGITLEKNKNKDNNKK